MTSEIFNRCLQIGVHYIIKSLRFKKMIKEPKMLIIAAFVCVRTCVLQVIKSNEMLKMEKVTS